MSSDRMIQQPFCFVNTSREPGVSSFGVLCVGRANVLEHSQIVLEGMGLQEQG
eukprot:CAMPEP_0177563578 /NCGR_PEP_ID=MMETSP0369-20130122/73143_1 /TAXON_ID=447022 ORGANISM="Scrippsiella hangoei-like, Strain SHHI-4" /NCGR_SAMPLE_ID=MMETSP0369 /ASSEMBLY_ACC=CAM_ASM_000364 /LENGTH=52 /DNA_ID=CAMNT_0019050781 /DNA_START=72 /DNA_END=226 /DNA_ORIENTATION=+